MNEGDDGFVRPTVRGRLEVIHGPVVIPQNGSTTIYRQLDDPSHREVALFEDQPTVISLRNPGDLPVTIDAIDVMEAPRVQDEEFEWCDADSPEGECLQSTGITLESGDSVEFGLRFRPVAAGRRDATLSIDYSDDRGTRGFDATVSGQGYTDPERPAQLLVRGEVSSQGVWGGHEADQDEVPGPMVADAEGNLYFAGTGFGLAEEGADQDIFVVRVNADGTLGWHRVYHATGDDEIAPTGDNLGPGAADAMAVDDEGYVYVVGRASNGGSRSLALIMKVDPEDGTAVWIRHWFGDTGRLQFTDPTAAFAVDVVEDTLYVVGIGKPDADSQGVAVFALDSDGTHLWSKLLVPQGNALSAHRGHTIRADGDGNLYVAGIDYSLGASGPFVAKLSGVDATGEAVAIDWVRLIDDPAMGSSVISSDLDDEGNLYLALDRRGAQTYFSLLGITPDGSATVGRTLPGAATDRNNVYVVRVAGDAVFAGGRLTVPEWDTSAGDGLIAAFSTGDLEHRWAGVYHTGGGESGLPDHSIRGFAARGDRLYLMGQVATAPANPGRRWGYWYDYPGLAEAYSPEVTDTTDTSILMDMPNAGFVDEGTPSFDNDGGFVPIVIDTSLLWLDTGGPDDDGFANDADVFLQFFDLLPPPPPESAAVIFYRYEEDWFPYAEFNSTTTMADMSTAYWRPFGHGSVRAVGRIVVSPGFVLWACHGERFQRPCQEFPPGDYSTDEIRDAVGTISSMEIELETTRQWWSQSEYLRASPRNARDGDWAPEAQGITHDDNYWYTSQKWWISQWPLWTNLNRSQDRHSDTDLDLRLEDNCGANHIGDIAYHNGYIYSAVETSEPGSSFIVVHGSNPRPTRGEPPGSGLALPLHHYLRIPQGDTPWVAVNPLNGLIYTANDSTSDDGVDLYVYRDQPSQPEQYHPELCGDVAFEQPYYTVTLHFEDLTPFETWSAHEGNEAVQVGGAFSPTGKFYLATRRYFYALNIRGDEGTVYRYWRNNENCCCLPGQSGPTASCDLRECSGHCEESEGLTIFNLDPVEGVHPDIFGHIHAVLLNNSTNLFDAIDVLHYRILDRPDLL